MTEPWLRRAARRALLLRVRRLHTHGTATADRAEAAHRSAERGIEWGEAMLAEFDQTTGSWEGLRWSASALRAIGRLRPATDPGSALVRLRRRAVVVVVSVVVLAVPVQAFAAGVAYIPSGAMAPTLQIDDRVIIDKVGFRWTGLAHGDVVTADVAGETMIKRVLGLPGDTIECRDGVLLRNGELVAEDYLEVGTRTVCDPLTVPIGTVYLLGDARESSGDSRIFGPVPIAAVTGRMVTSIRL
ncbi:signal peptidase I [Allocatelliglobosispora scoriae]|uniref:Signal peptidase I n=1 Tax=Allocatelliglobosispora scoriae TaxID=643052 RepID=A0A841BPB3_9ACTN|nr:signal peptidase I [Allocatelliglobosispora scoriae]MBB5869218.1 signal peptidase I [Allocatelliglobosispora scoriae]